MRIFIVFSIIIERGFTTRVNLEGSEFGDIWAKAQRKLPVEKANSVKGVLKGIGNFLTLNTLSDNKKRKDFLDSFKQTAEYGLTICLKQGDQLGPAPPVSDAKLGAKIESEIINKIVKLTKSSEGTIAKNVDQ